MCEPFMNDHFYSTEIYMKLRRTHSDPRADTMDFSFFFYDYIQRLAIWDRWVQTEKVNNNNNNTHLRKKVKLSQQQQQQHNENDWIILTLCPCGFLNGKTKTCWEWANTIYK